MAVEVFPVQRTIPREQTESVSISSRVKESLKDRMQLVGRFTLLWISPPVLEWIGKQHAEHGYARRRKVAKWIDEKLEKRNMKTLDLVHVFVEDERLGYLPDIIEDMPRVSQVEVLIAFAPPQIRKLRKNVPISIAPL